MKGLQQEITKLPPSPGIYFFKNQAGEIIYIGKSINLRNRVRSYFQNKSLGEYTQRMIGKIVDIDFRVCKSEFEALLLEAKLINQHQPKYNARGKDDKRFLMIAVSCEDYPRVYTARERQKKGIYFGPFPSSNEVRRVLKTIRRIFGFRSCKRLPKKTCLYYHLHLCPGCCLGISKKEYKKIIKKIIRFLNGDTKGLLRQLQKEMKAVSKLTDFEKAGEIKKQIEAINYVVLNWQSLSDSELKFGLFRDYEQAVLKEVKKIFSKIKNLSRIEAYDVSNLYGKHASGSMIVFQDLSPAKDQYRRFKIKTLGIDDVAMIEEVLRRRLKHKEWQYPQLIIIDGGKGQAGSAFSVLRKYKLEDKIYILGLTKKEEIIIKPVIRNKIIISYKEIKIKKNSLTLRLLQNLRNQSHYFAKKYHLWLRKKQHLTEYK